MAKWSELTSFTKDVQGRYLCNDFSEAEAWRTVDGRPFDLIVVGGGTFGAAIGEHLWYRQRQLGGGLRTGLFGLHGCRVPLAVICGSTRPMTYRPLR